MRRHGVARTVGLIVVAVFAVSAIGYVLLQPAMGWPRESRRVVHPAGFSVVAPDGWERNIRFASADGKQADVLQFIPVRVVGRSGGFGVSRRTTPRDEADLREHRFKPATFDGRPAWQLLEDQPRFYTHSRVMVFERDGAQFEISLNRPTGESVDAGAWQAYFASFRVEKHAALPADGPLATRPSP